jgi:prepilin-type processing-associated H-X9-DG protein
MKCPNCGKEVDDKALFCDNCGASLAAQTAEAVKSSEEWTEPAEPRRGSNVWLIVAAVGGGCLVLGIALIAILGAILFPVFNQARGKARQVACQSNLKQFATAVLMYQQDWSGKVKENGQVVEGGMFPLAGTWASGVMPYTKNLQILRCPSVVPPGTTVPGAPPGAQPVTDYGFNSALSGVVDAKISQPASTILFFETSGTSAGGAESVAQPGRHEGSNNFAFVDGHVKAIRDGMLGPSGMVWSPKGQPSGTPLGGQQQQMMKQRDTTAPPPSSPTPPSQPAKPGR